MKVEISDKVLVPFDYSEFCASSLKYALQVFDPSQIEVIHVAHVPMANSPGVIWDQVNEDTVREHCQKSFDSFCEKHDLPGDLTFKVEFGGPAECIAKYARDHSVGMVVISSHGRKGVMRWFLGSVAERVVRLSPCPVLVFKPEEIVEEQGKKISEMEG